MNTLERLTNARPKPRHGVLLCRWEQLDEGTLTATWRAARLVSVADPSPLDPIVPGSPEHSSTGSHRPDGDIRGFSIARDIEARSVWPDGLTKWISRVADTARVALLSVVMVAVCTSSVHLVERALTGPSEAVDLLSGS